MGACWGWVRSAAGTADVNGSTGGTTGFTLTQDAGTTVTLTAPASAPFLSTGRITDSTRENAPLSVAATSPAVGTGTSYLAPATDFAGNARPGPQGYDRGAYQQQ